jgi:hypothetical protein
MAKKSVTISLKMSELINDIHNKTYLTGESRKDGTNHETVAHIKSNDDEEDMDQLLRSIKNAYANLKTKLSEFIVDSTTTKADNTAISEDSTLSFALTMPSNYNLSTAETVAEAAHQYIVNNAIADWFSITDKADAEDYVNMATANLTIIIEAINKRVRPTKRTEADA